MPAVCGGRRLERGPRSPGLLGGSNRCTEGSVRRAPSRCCWQRRWRSPPVSAQEFRGRINGIVTDASGAVLPGVTVTGASPALIQPQTTSRARRHLPAHRAAGRRLRGHLRAGRLKTHKREGIRVVIGTTLSVDAKLEVATLEETVTVTGESPIVDTSTTAVGTNFTKELLTEIPNARDVWAPMSQAPGSR